MKSVSPITRSPLCRVDDDEVVGRDRPQADGVGRIRLVRPVPLAVGVVDEPLLRQHRQHLLHVSPRAELLVVRERQLERRALHVVEQDVQVVGVDQRVLGRRVEEIRRVADDELVDRRAAGDEHRRRPRRCAGRRGPRAARSPRSCPGYPAITDTSSAPMSMPSSSALVETTARTVPFAQAALDLAAAVRQVAAAIAANHVRLRQAGRETRPSNTWSGSRPRAGSARTGSAGGCASGTRARRGALRDRYERRMPSCALTTGGFTNRKNFSPRGAPLSVDQLERTAGQPFGQLARIRDRRRRADEDRIRAVVPADRAAAAGGCWRGGCRTRRDTRAARR